MPTAPARPLLRHDVAFLEARDGLLVRRDGVNYVVRGRSAYHYLSALVPHLDGTHTLDEIVAGLPPAQADSVVSLVSALASKGALIDLPPVREDECAHLADTYADQRLLLLHHGDDGSGFARVTRCRVLVAGRDPDDVGALAAALRDNGVGAAATGVAEADRLESADLDGVDLVIHTETAAHTGEILRVARCAEAGRVAVLPVVRIGDEIMIGPWQDPADRGEITSALLRLAENAVPGADQVLIAGTLGPAAGRRAAVLPPAAGLIANSLAAFEAFKAISQTMATQVRDGAVFLDATTLTARAEHHCPHPAVSDRVSALPVPSPKTDEANEAAYTRYSALVQAHLGIMTSFADDDLPQIPVRVGLLQAPACEDAAYVEFGTDTVLDCRLRALERAAAQHALATHDRVDLLPTPDPGARLASVEGAGPARPGEALVAARDHLDGTPWALPRSAVLAGDQLSAAALHTPTTAGLRAAPTPALAAARAVLDVAGHRAIDRIAAGLAPVARVPRAAADDLPVLRSLLAAARSEGIRVQMYADLDPVPVALVARGDDRLATAAFGLTWVDAAVAALAQVLGRHQLRATRWGATSRTAHRHIGLDDLRLRADLDDIAALTRATDADRIAGALGIQGLAIALVDLTTPDLAQATTVARAVLHRPTPMPADPCTPPQTPERSTDDHAR